MLWSKIGTQIVPKTIIWNFLADVFQDVLDTVAPVILVLVLQKQFIFHLSWTIMFCVEKLPVFYQSRFSAGIEAG